MTNYRVLLVEDDGVTRKILSRQLNLEGFELIACASAEEALLQKAEHPDIRILITDWQLPGMSGLELCQEFRQFSELHYVLLMTSSREEHSKVTALESGADAFLSKPTTPGDLHAHLRIAARLLDQQAALNRRLADLQTANQALEDEMRARRRAEVRVRQSHDFLERLIGGLPYGILVGNRAGRVRNLNQSVTRIFGFQSEVSDWTDGLVSALHDSLSRFVGSGPHQDELRDFLCTGTPSRRSLRIQLASGRSVGADYFSLESDSSLSDSGSESGNGGSLWIFRDITEEVAARNFEVKVARQVQQGLLMGSPPLDTNYQIAALTQPSLEVDGDFVHFVHGGDSLDVVVGDVMGKGIPAALLGAGIKTQLLQLQAELGPLASPARFLTRLNQDTASQMATLNSFLTMFYARIDLRKGNLIFADAGHTKPILWSHSSGNLQILEGPNTPLGFVPSEEYQDVTVPVEAGDLLVLYSDGLTEATNLTGEYYGLDRLCQLVRDYSGESTTPQQLAELVQQSLLEHLGGRPATDDTSLVIIRILSRPSHHFLCRAETQSLSDIYFLPSLRDFVVQTCRQAGMAADSNWYFELELAASEAISNVIRHSYKGRSDGPIRILVRVFADEVIVRIYHQGIPIPANRRQPKKIESPQESGMGLFLIAQVTDQILYGQDPASVPLDSISGQPVQALDIHWVEFTKRIPGDVLGPS